MINRIKNYFKKHSLKSEIKRLEKLQWQIYLNPETTKDIHEDAQEQIKTIQEQLKKTQFHLESALTALLVANRWRKSGKPKKTSIRVVETSKLSDSDQEFIRRLDEAKRNQNND